MLPQIPLELGAVRAERAEATRLFATLQAPVAVEAAFPLEHPVAVGARKHPHGRRAYLRVLWGLHLLVSGPKETCREHDSIRHSAISTDYEPTVTAL